MRTPLTVTAIVLSNIVCISARGLPLEGQDFGAHSGLCQHPTIVATSSLRSSAGEITRHGGTHDGSAENMFPADDAFLQLVCPWHVLAASQSIPVVILHSYNVTNSAAQQAGERCQSWSGGFRSRHEIERGRRRRGNKERKVESYRDSGRRRRRTIGIHAHSFATRHARHSGEKSGKRRDAGGTPKQPTSRRRRRRRRSRKHEVVSLATIKTFTPRRAAAGSGQDVLKHEYIDTADFVQLAAGVHAQDMPVLAIRAYLQHSVRSVDCMVLTRGEDGTANGAEISQSLTTTGQKELLGTYRRQDISLERDRWLANYTVAPSCRHIASDVQREILERFRAWLHEPLEHANSALEPGSIGGHVQALREYISRAALVVECFTSDSPTDVIAANFAMRDMLDAGYSWRLMQIGPKGIRENGLDQVLMPSTDVSSSFGRKGYDRVKKFRSYVWNRLRHHGFGVRMAVARSVRGNPWLFAFALLSIILWLFSKPVFQVLGGRVIAIALWICASIAMSFVNKHTVDIFQNSSLLVIFQMIISAIVLVIFESGRMQCGRWSDLIKWAPVPVLFAGILGTSLLALKASSVSTVLILRNVLPLVTLTIEKLLGAARAGATSLQCVFLLVVLVGTVTYGRWHAAVTARGIAIMLSNCSLVTVDRLLQSHLLKSSEFSVSAPSCALFNNIAGILPILALAATTGELWNWRSAIALAPPTTWCWVLLSGCCGCCLGYFSLLAQRLLSATSFLVLQNMSKVVIIVLAVALMGDRMTGYSAFGCCLSMAGSFGYCYLQLPVEIEAVCKDDAECKAERQQPKV